MFKSLLKVGFIDIVRESTALTQMLSASAWHLQGNEDDVGGAMGGFMGKSQATDDYARYSVVATRSLRKKLCSPRSRASNEVVIAVLAFAAYGVSRPQYLCFIN